MKKLLLLTLLMFSSTGFSNHLVSENIVCQVPKKQAPKKAKVKAVKAPPTTIRYEVQKTVSEKDVTVNVNQWANETAPCDNDHEMMDQDAIIRMLKKSEAEKDKMALELSALRSEHEELMRSYKGAKKENEELKAQVKFLNREYYLVERRKSKSKASSSDSKVFLGLAAGYGPTKIKDESSENSDTFDEVHMEYGAIFGGRVSGVVNNLNLGLNAYSNRTVTFDISLGLGK